MSTKHTTVLFVDDDVAFLEVVQNLMRACSEDSWEILVAPDAARALAAIREAKIDLLVIDVHMPVMDGLQFLGLLHRKYPSLSKVVLTGDATEQYRAACLSNGAELFLEKPTSQDGWQSVYSALNELVRFQPEDGFRGVLRRMGLQDVLQMECLARSSSTLEISAGSVQGKIYVQDGRIVHAQAGTLAGEEAFNHLMSFSGGQFNLKPFVEPPARTIEGSWEFLLMEAARKRDEAVEKRAAKRAAEASIAGVDLPPFEAGQLLDGASIQAAEETIEASTEGADPVAEPLADRFTPEESTETVHLEPVPPPEPGIEPVLSARPRIDEMLICSTQGDVLYEWQCADANARIRFLQFLSQKSWQLRQGLSIGFLERIEIEGPKSRIVTRIEPDRALFVRASHMPVENEGEPGQ